MIQIKADSMVAFGRLLGFVSEDALAIPFSGEVELESGGGFGRAPRVLAVRPRPELAKKTRLEGETLEPWMRFMEKTQTSCKHLELGQSYKQVERVINRLKGPQPTLGDVLSMTKELCQRIIDELADKVTLQLDDDKSSLFEHQSAFGEEVFRKFPSANDDIFEAATCLALDRGTASVMHLCRVVEIGLRALANQLCLPCRPDWGKHLDDIEKELTRRYKASATRAADELFYAEAAAQIGHIKTAWRNPSMHADKTYTPERAMDIFRAVDSFMRHLATKIQE